MDEIQPVSTGTPPLRHPGWDALSADVRALGGQGDVRARRRGVALRLLAAGIPRDALEDVLPGWKGYLDPPSPTAEAVA